MLGGAGDPARLLAADVGAGTGISARLLADRGPRVLAVEPNEAMRAAAAPHPRVTWRRGTAEATGLDAGSVDLIVSAQAFHWFREEEALREFHRVLRSGGRLALMWNRRDRSDAATRGYTDAVRAVHGDSAGESREFDAGVIHRGGWFAPATVLRWPHHQDLDREGLIGRATSASAVPREGPAHAELLRLLGDAYDLHRDSHGVFRLRYVTELYLAERR